FSSRRRHTRSKRDWSSDVCSSDLAYVDLRHMIAGKNYHIITTNADNAFYAAEFDMDKVFRIQGEYGLLQCSEHCHQQTYKNEDLIREMVEKQSNMKDHA